METRDFPSVIEAGKVAQRQLEFFREMMKDPKVKERTLKMFTKYKRFWGTSTPEERAIIWEKMNEEDSILMMKVAIKLNRPAVEPLSDLLVEAVPRLRKDHMLRCMVGALAWEILEPLGYIRTTDAFCHSEGCIFTRGMRYLKFPGMAG